MICETSFPSFQGRLYPVNSRKETVARIEISRGRFWMWKGPSTWRSLSFRPRAVPKAIEDCCDKGVRYLVVETAVSRKTQERQAGKSNPGIMDLNYAEGKPATGPERLARAFINTIISTWSKSIGSSTNYGRANVGLYCPGRACHAAGILTGLRNVLDFGIIATIGNKMDNKRQRTSPGVHGAKTRALR